jgi:tetratricopeptide (TPR) repeat protein
MKRWTTAIFPWVIVVALLLIVARFLLPMIGLAAVDGNTVRILSKLTPAALTMLIGSIALIIYDLRRKSRFMEVESKEEAQEDLGWELGQEFEIPRPATPAARPLTPPTAPRREPQREKISPPAPLEAAGAFGAQKNEAVRNLESRREEEVIQPDPPKPFDLKLSPELERKIDEMFGKKPPTKKKSANISSPAPREPEMPPAPPPQAPPPEGDVILAYLEQYDGTSGRRSDPLSELNLEFPEPPEQPPMEAAPSGRPMTEPLSFDMPPIDPLATNLILSEIMEEASPVEEPAADEIVETARSDREDDEEQDERFRKKVSPEMIARYQQLIESANNPVLTLFQLPPLPAEFSGRSDELEDLLRAHATLKVNVLGLQGLGGIGKTTLALKLAERLKSQYSDAQFYIDLKGAGAQPVSIADAQSHVIRAFLPTVRLPEDLEEIDQLYRSLLGERRAIVLLDNAADDQQITPLLAPEGCLTIITSRQQITTPNSYLRRLEGLPEPEARELLLKLAPRIGRDADKVAELCDYLPLALKLAAGLLLINPELKVNDYIRELESLQLKARGEGQHRRSIDSVLSISYQRLAPGLRKLWRILAVFNDTFDANAAASVWKLQVSRAVNALDRLTVSCMVERNRATGRARLHDLMAAFAEAQLLPDERGIACQRHSAHYQSVLHEADALYEQGGDLMKLGLDLVDLEWKNIQAGQLWASAGVDQDRDARELCNSYPDAGKFALELRQHPRERIRWSQAALTAAKKMNRHKAAARHLVALGDSYAALSEIPQAMDCYQQALDITRNTRDRRGEAEALSGFGMAHYLSGSLGRARELHRDSMTLYSEANDPRGEASALGNLAYVHYATGELKRAGDLFEKQLKLAQQIGDRRNESVALGGLGVLQYSMGDGRQAAQLLNQQLTISREIGDRRSEAAALTHLGYACSILKYAGQATAYQEQALTIAREIGDRRSEATALGGLGVSELLSGDAVRAVELHEAQLKITRDISDRHGEAKCLERLGEALTALGQTARAMDVFQQSFNINSELGDITGQANSLFMLAFAMEKQGDRRQAIENAETASRLYEIAGHPKVAVVESQLKEWR